MIDINAIEKAIADYEPPPDPFNGATRLVLASDVLEALSPHIEPWARNPLMGRCPEIEVRPTMPAGHGLGFRKWRAGDDPEMEVIGEVCVWMCGTFQPATGQ